MVDFIEDRLSALHTAAFTGQTEIARLLIDNKCNVNILTKLVGCCSAVILIKFQLSPFRADCKHIKSD